MTSTDVPPRWDVSDVFPSLTSRSFAAAMEGLEADASRLAARYDEAGIGAVEPHDPTAEEIAVLDEILAATNTAQQMLSELRTYVTAFVAVDAGDEAGQAASSRLERSGAALRKLSARLAPWVAALGPEALAGASPTAAEHLFALERAALRSEHQMEPAEEALYADLALTGSSAWQRLWADTTALLEADVALPAGPARLGMAAVRGLGMHPDPAVRRAGYEAELATWPSVAVACAAAMNAIKGEADLVNTRRRWDDPLDASLFANAVDRPTFDAMHAAVTEALPAFRRWLRVKARLLGHGTDRGLPWWDLFAPLPRADGATLSWDEGVGVVTDAFARYSPQLRRVIDRATSERWLDAEARPGKRGGAFCAPFVGDRSIVLMNWAGSFDSAQTLAHELGHAYHNVQLAPRTPLQRQLPMALAETASIFCETLVVAAGLAEATGAARLALLDTDLIGATQVVVDIRSRITFEAEVFRRRRATTLSPRELCELMLAAQRDAYGDGLDHATLHPYMWAVKPHYYSAHFYNWPYTFGLLFGLGLFAQYERDPERFRDGYDDLLSACGMADAATLGARFGLDVRDGAFWAASLDVLVGRMAEYEQLAAGGSAVPGS